MIQKKNNKYKINKSFKLYFTVRFCCHKLKSLFLNKKTFKKEIFEENILNIYSNTIYFKIWRIYCFFLSNSFYEYLLLLKKIKFKINSENDLINLDQKKFDKKIIKKNAEQSLITCVIPTLNAGYDLKFVLQALIEQDVQIKKIIVIDSGSTDHTLDIAKKFNCEIIKIDKKNFSHSGTRNFALKFVDTPYVYFTVQDCVLSSKFTLSTLQQIMNSNKLSAITNPQNPRMDADEYSCITTFYHNKVFYNFPYGSYKIFDTLGDKYNQRYNTQLDNVSCLYFKEHLIKHKFRGEFAEDVNIAIDLIKDHKKVARANIFPVIHSHTRPWLYHLKRSYVESKAIKHEREIQKNISSDDGLITLKQFYYLLCIFRIYRFNDLKFIFGPIKQGKFKLSFFLNLLKITIQQYKFFYSFRGKLLTLNLLRIILGVILAEKLSNYLTDKHKNIIRELGENV